MAKRFRQTKPVKLATPEPGIRQALDKVSASSWRQGLLGIALVVCMGGAA